MKKIFAYTLTKWKLSNYSSHVWWRLSFLLFFIIEAQVATEIWNRILIK